MEMAAKSDEGEEGKKRDERDGRPNSFHIFCNIEDNEDRTQYKYIVFKLIITPICIKTKALNRVQLNYINSSSA